MKRGGTHSSGTGMRVARSSLRIGKVAEICVPSLTKNLWQAAGAKVTREGGKRNSSVIVGVSLIIMFKVAQARHSSQGRAPKGAWDFWNLVYERFRLAGRACGRCWLRWQHQDAGPMAAPHVRSTGCYEAWIGDTHDFDCSGRERLCLLSIHRTSSTV